MNINFDTEIIQFLKETTLPTAALVIFAAVILTIYKLLNTDGPFSQWVFKSKNPRWDIKIPLMDGDKLNQLLEDIKRQEVFRKLVNIDTDVSKIDLLMELKNNHPTKINYRMIRNAMSYLRFNNDVVTVEITRKDKVLDTFLVVLFAIPIIFYSLLGIVLIIEDAVRKPQNDDFTSLALLLLMLVIITILSLTFLRSSYVSAKRIKEIVDENLKILLKEIKN